MLHAIWQRHHKLPSEILDLPWHERTFLYASEEIVAEEEKEAQEKADKEAARQNRRKGG